MKIFPFLSQTTRASVWRTSRSLVASVGLLALAWPNAAKAQYNLTLQVMGATIAFPANLENVCITGWGVGGPTIDIAIMPASPLSASITVAGCTATDWLFAIDQIPAGFEVDFWAVGGAEEATLDATNPHAASLTGISATQTNPVQVAVIFKEKQSKLSVSVSSGTPWGGVNVTAPGFSSTGITNNENAPMIFPFKFGTVVTLTPTPDSPDSVFSHFAINDPPFNMPHPNVGFNPPTATYTLTMGHGDEDVVAVFTRQFTITQMNADPNMPALALNGPVVLLGDQNTWVAPPFNECEDSSNPGIKYVLAGWTNGSGDISPSGSTTTGVNIPHATQNSALTWVWRKCCALDVWWDETAGSVSVLTGNGVSADTGVPQNPNRWWFVVDDPFVATTLTATAMPGCHFVGWSLLDRTPADPRNAVLNIPAGFTDATLPTASFFISATFLPILEDSNGDGVPDWWCLLTGLDPFGMTGLGSHAMDDPDNDGLTNAQEYRLTYSNQYEIIVCDPLNWDTSGDGMDDGWKHRCMVLGDPEYPAHTQDWVPAPMNDGSLAPIGRYGANDNPDGDYGWDFSGPEPVPRPLANIREYEGPDGQPPLIPNPANPVIFPGLSKPVCRAIANPLDTGDATHPFINDTDPNIQDIVYVDASRPGDSGTGRSWGTAKQSIQAALDILFEGGVVVVTNGVYAPFTSLNRRVAIRSVNGAADTLILGGAGQRCATLGSEAGHFETTLSGFTLAYGSTLENGGGALHGTLENCALWANVAMNNGGGAHGGVLRNCVLAENWAMNQGGGASLAILDNCTLSANTALTAGGGADFSVLNNCVAWGNNAPLFENQFGCALSHTCVTPLPFPGNGNLDADPLFVDAANGDFRLQPGSPCIDAGMNGHVSTAFDIAGNPRVSNHNVDMGAHEFQAAILANPGVSSITTTGIFVGEADGETREIRLDFAYDGTLGDAGVMARMWEELDGGDGEPLQGNLLDNHDGTASLSVKIPANLTRAFFRLEVE